MSLVKIDQHIVSGTENTVVIGNSNWDSSYDVYLLSISGATCDNNAVIQCRVNVSSTADSSANYDTALKILQSSSAVANYGFTNGTSVPLSANRMQSGAGRGFNGNFWVYQANNSGTYTYLTKSTSGWREASGAEPQQNTSDHGGFLNSVNQAINGFTFYYDLGTDNFTAGQFTLYGLET